MFTKELLPELKGAPLSIIFLLAMTGNRTISVSDLSIQTGFDRKTTRKGLDILMEHKIVTSPRTNRYQLVGKNVQLPLYWDEKIEPLPAAESECGNFPQRGNFPQLEDRIEDLERRVANLEECGNIPQCGKIPQLCGNIPQNDMVIDMADCGKNTQWGNFPQEKGNNSPNVNLINIENTGIKEVSKYVDIDAYLLDVNSNNTKLPKGENFPNQEKIPHEALNAWNACMQQMKGQMGRGSYMDILHGAVPAGYEDGHYTVLVENQFKRDWAEARLTQTLEKILSGILGVKVSVSFAVDLQTEQDQGTRFEDQDEAPSLELLPGSGELTEICNAYLLDPIGINYSMSELKELISMNPDPEVLRFVLPIATRFENAKTWCGKDLQSAKRILLKKFGIVNGMAAEIVHNDAATLEMINEICTELCPENKNAVGSRIRQMTSDGKIPEL